MAKYFTPAEGGDVYWTKERWNGRELPENWQEIAEKADAEIDRHCALFYCDAYEAEEYSSRLWELYCNIGEEALK